MERMDLLEKLCLALGGSGEEDAVRACILEEISPYAQISFTRLGDIIAEKKGEKTPPKKLMLAAHMDEVSMIVQEITPEGYLKFLCVGGIDSKILLGKTVYINGKIRGLIGGKPVHLMDGEEKEKAVPLEELSIDIGASHREEAAKVVNVGDPVYFEPYFLCQDGAVFAKSLDDRVGCYLLIRMIQSPQPYDMTFVFSTREEIGCVGGKVAAEAVSPQLAIAVEGTVAGDVQGQKGAKTCTKLSAGSAISMIDRGTVYDQKFFRLAFRLAEEHGIPCQARTCNAGRNDASVMQQAGQGARVAALSVPCRYIHSPVSLAKVEDIDRAAQLLPLLAKGMIESDD
jgi:putative aminopeptidase FrvX